VNTFKIDHSRIDAIGACTLDGAYGLRKDMPWSDHKTKLPGDLPRFAHITSDAPDDKVNLLIAGSITAETMKELDLGPKRLLVSVSRNHPVELLSTPESLSRHERIVFVRSFKDAPPLLHSPIVNKAIFIGGRACWEFGFKLAGMAYITLAVKEYPGEEYTRPRTPLHLQAEMAGFVLAEDGKVTKDNPAAWPPVYIFLDYIREK
jgi:dihydrofolate reductase